MRVGSVSEPPEYQTVRTDPLQFARRRCGLPAVGGSIGSVADSERLKDLKHDPLGLLLSACSLILGVRAGDRSLRAFILSWRRNADLGSRQSHERVHQLGGKGIVQP